MVVRGPERYARGIVVAAIDVAERAAEVVNFVFAEARLRSAVLRATVVRLLLRSDGGPISSAPPPRDMDDPGELAKRLPRLYQAALPNLRGGWPRAS